MNTVQQVWHYLRSSFWFLPGLIVLSGIALAVILIAVDSWMEKGTLDRWSTLFGAGAEGARGMLSAIASSMITVAGVAFSITIVALSLASNQYSSRVLRNFMRDPLNQTVLGVFLAVFAYCLVVLRVIRGPQEGDFVPSIAVLGGVVLAFVGIGFFIAFIHHIAYSIQASSILLAIAKETLGAVDNLFPEGLGHGKSEDDDHQLPDLNQVTWQPVPARSLGYIQSINNRMMIEFARQRQVMIRMERSIGDFVAEGIVLASVSGDQPPNESLIEDLNDVYTINSQRSVEQDTAFGIRQLVDVALKALSPSVNETTNALMCIDYLMVILSRLASRRIEPRHRFDDDQLRVIARGPTFQSLVDEAFDQIRENAGGNVEALKRLIHALETVGRAAVNERRRRILLEHLERVVEVADRTVSIPFARSELKATQVCARRLLASDQ